MSNSKAQFAPGQLIEHRLFAYRGVVVDVDPRFSLTQEWYKEVARSRPPQDEPWYHVLPDGAEHMTYVAEQNLGADTSNQPVKHPLIAEIFSGFENGRYVQERVLN